MDNKTQKNLLKALVEMSKYHQQMSKTLTPLITDMNFALSNLKSDKENQHFWRRTIIRCILAYTEALLWNTKQGIPLLALVTGVELKANDLELIQEGKGRFPKFRDNLKDTFKLFAKVHKANFKMNYDQGFDALCQTYELRSRLMHPKQPADPEVSNSDIVASQKGVKWLQQEFYNLITACKQAIPHIGNQ